jgi:hypothetical protein
MRVRAVAALLTGTVALGVALDLGPHDRALAMSAYLDFVCAVLLICIARTIRTSLPPGAELRRAHRQRHSRASRPDQLAWLERQVGDERYFRPLAERIASATLARKHGIVLEREPGRARALLGERLWSFIRPGERQRDVDVRRAIEDLEAIQ